MTAGGVFLFYGEWTLKDANRFKGFTCAAFVLARWFSDLEELLGCSPFRFFIRVHSRSFAVPYSTVISLAHAVLVFIELSA